MSSRFVVTVALSVALVSACARSDARLVVPPEDAPLATARCAAPGTTDYYFAPGQINSARDDQFQRSEWFATYLRIASAEPLSCGASREAYRVLWMPSFRNARVLTIAMVDGGWLLTAADFGERPLHEWKQGDVPAMSVTRLSPDDLRRVRDELTAVNFWYTPQYRNDSATMDGTALVIEGRSSDRYRAITRINQWDGAERLACVLFQLANLKLPEYPECPKPVVLPR